MLPAGYWRAQDNGERWGFSIDPMEVLRASIADLVLAARKTVEEGNNGIRSIAIKGVAAENELV